MIVIIFYPSIKTDVLDAQKNHLIETVLLSTHNRFWFEGRSSPIFVKPELGSNCLQH